MNMNLEINKSKIQGSKKAIFSMSLILMLTMTLMMTFAQPTSGQAGVTGVSTGETTAGYITVAPTLVGVGQTLTVNAWVNPVPTAYDYASYWNGFYGVTVTFVRPDGTKDTFMPTDGTGGYVPGQMQGLGALFFYYKPSMAGNWSISFTMPVQNITTSAGTVIYSACTSNTFYFTVQTDMVLAGLLNGYPWAELPNANVYWSYPINDNNREWYQISGDWTGTTTTAATVVSPTQTKWQPYGSGPSTAHIVWTSPFIEGGLVGGSFGSIDYYAGIPRYVIMDGMVYVNLPNTTPYGQAFGKFECIDLNTGQVLYTANGSITSGIHLPNLLGAYQQSATAVAVGEAITLLASSYGAYQYPFLYGTVTVSGIQYWNFYQALTGVLTRQFANASSGRLVDGTVLGFGAGTIVGQTGNWVWRWNMTSVVNNNWPTGITWKVPSPKTLTGANAAIFAVSPDLTTVVVGTKNQYWGYNADTGALLWNLTVNYAITSNEEIPLGMVNDFIIWDSVAATWHCYSEITGAELWETPSVASSPWATTFSIYDTESNDLNNLYCANCDGIVYAFSLTDGHLVWQSPAIKDPTGEYPNNALPYVHTGSVMMGGIFYAYAGYSASYQLDPVPRFAMNVAINCTTGDIIWTLNGGVMVNAAANGYILGVSDYDGQTYCIGKGPTSTTVSAPQTAITAGTPVTILGSVLDTSPASSSETLSAMFANGVPAISDDNMSAWMDYLHMQNSTMLNNPPYFTGVPVTLTAVDSNGNFLTIGTATSDNQGNYGLQWTPTTPGEYHIYASFAGSNAFFSSYASTYATVSTAAATTTPAPTTTSAPSNFATTTDLMTYIVVGVIAMIIAIAVATVLILRKK